MLTLTKGDPPGRSTTLILLANDVPATTETASLALPGGPTPIRVEGFTNPCACGIEFVPALWIQGTPFPVSKETKKVVPIACPSAKRRAGPSVHFVPSIVPAVNGNGSACAGSILVGGRNSIVVEVRSLLRVRRFLTREDFHQQKTCDRDSSSSCAYPFTRGSGSSVDCASGSLTQVVMMQTSDERHLDYLSTVR